MIEAGDNFTLIIKQSEESKTLACLVLQYIYAKYGKEIISKPGLREFIKCLESCDKDGAGKPAYNGKIFTATSVSNYAVMSDGYRFNPQYFVFNKIREKSYETEQSENRELQGDQVL